MRPIYATAAALAFCLALWTPQSASANHHGSFGLSLSLSTDRVCYGSSLVETYRAYDCYDSAAYSTDVYYYPTRSRRVMYLDDYYDRPVYYRTSYREYYPATDFVIINNYHRPYYNHERPWYGHHNTVWYDRHDWDRRHYRGGDYRRGSERVVVRGHERGGDRVVIRGHERGGGRIVARGHERGGGDRVAIGARVGAVGLGLSIGDR